MHNESYCNLCERLRGEAHRVSCQNARFDRDDVLQESAVQLFRQLQANQAFVASGAWIKTIVRGHAAKLFRHHKAARRTMTRESSFNLQKLVTLDSPEQQAMLRERSTMVSTAVSSLLAEQQFIIKRRFEFDESFNQIAMRMAKSPSYVRRQYHKALSSLRARVAQ